MKKRVYTFLTAVLLCVLSILPVYAEDGFVHEYYRVMDTAALLSEEDLETLITRLDEISMRQKMEVAIATTDTLDGTDIVEYADGLYDFCEYGYGENRDGLLLVISTEDNDWYITTHGYGITAFTDAGIEYIGSQMRDNLSAGDFVAAFNTYADLCDDFITQARNGTPYDTSSLPSEPSEPLSVIWMPISLVIGVIIAFIAVGSMKSKLKTVRFQVAASSYMKNNSLNITESRDLFLYHTVSRREKPKKTSAGGSSTHTSSSGSTHGGGGGKF